MLHPIVVREVRCFARDRRLLRAVPWLLLAMLVDWCRAFGLMSGYCSVPYLMGATAFVGSFHSASREFTVEVHELLATTPLGRRSIANAWATLWATSVVLLSGVEATIFSLVTGAPVGGASWTGVALAVLGAFFGSWLALAWWWTFHDYWSHGLEPRPDKYSLGFAWMRWRVPSGCHQIARLDLSMYAGVLLFACIQTLIWLAASGPSSESQSRWSTSLAPLLVTCCFMIPAVFPAFARHLDEANDISDQLATLPGGYRAIYSARRFAGIILGVGIGCAMMAAGWLVALYNGCSAGRLPELMIATLVLPIVGACLAPER